MAASLPAVSLAWQDRGRWWWLGSQALNGPVLTQVLQQGACSDSCYDATSSCENKKEIQIFLGAENKHNSACILNHRGLATPPANQPTKLNQQKEQLF